MNFTQSFKLALKSLKTSKMRAFLTMLGIIIGVGAVIVILSLGNGMTNMMNSQFEKMGSNLIQVMTYGRGTGGTRDVDVEDLYELVDKYPQYLTGVTPYVSASAKVRYQTDDHARTSVYGVSEAFFDSIFFGSHIGQFFLKLGCVNMRSLCHTCRNGIPSRKRYNLASIFQNNSISLLISSLNAHPMIHSIRANIALNRVERPFHEPSVIKSTVDGIYVCLGENFTTFACDFQKFHIILLLFYISFPRIAAIF